MPLQDLVVSIDGIVVVDDIVDIVFCFKLNQSAHLHLETGKTRLF
jgi:hypothetical protein